MAHFFQNHPQINYDLLKNNKPRTIQNPLVRYKIKDIWRDRSAVYYRHDIEEGQTAQFIAHRYYDDVTLDWIIYVVNDMLDPYYDWPLDYQPFINFIKAKYTTVESALNTTHHYEWIYQAKQVLYDNTIVPEKKIIVDATTYAGLPVDSKREVSNYTYEQELNDAKRNIRILRSEYIDLFISEAESIFE